MASCGDGVVQVGEACDDANADNTDDCLDTCLAASCGDGFVQLDVEMCDDGNDIDTDDCPASCAPAVCGDGFVWEGNEEATTQTWTTPTTGVSPPDPTRAHFACRSTRRE
ncbi:DUF4215 domain-containing protein [Enhygromyxa salina]|uniref:DUF4215 domain-containing protein n=1 Tax=Enhygromyxa salina TaxID=215803 RepID=UPI000696AB67